jgi:ornithine decarboxylase
VINETLDSEFPEEMGVRVIAEPGRYFAETSATLFT